LPPSSHSHMRGLNDQPNTTP